MHRSKSGRVFKPSMKGAGVSVIIREYDNSKRNRTPQELAYIIDMTFQVLQKKSKMIEDVLEQTPLFEHWEVIAEKFETIIAAEESSEEKS